MMNRMTHIDRRSVIALSGAALLTPSPLMALNSKGKFGWSQIQSMAQSLAIQPYVETPLYPAAAKVDYDALHQARFRDDRTIWNDLPGHTGIRLFPLNAHAAQPVSISLIEEGKERPIPYDPNFFDMPAGNPIGNLGPDAGYAGFRIMNAARDGDWLSFLGASYFRASGAEKQFGLSARAIAINTSIPGKEEFPRFTRFWLERAGDDSITVYALLDGASITGAYRFENRFSAKGVHQDITATLFPRRPIAELGLMPMTSMFWYDQSRRIRTQDWRPEVHDSDLLSIALGNGTVIARPLDNPSAPTTSVFSEQSPKGFGLLQRDRHFDHYQDDGVFYERRPSLWASAQSDWGKGDIRLYAFPTDSEYVDNIATYWTPKIPARAGRRLDTRYSLDWTANPAPAPFNGPTLDNIWRGKTEDGNDRIVIDFVEVPENKKLDIFATIVGGSILKKAGYYIQGKAGAYRTVIDLQKSTASAELHVQLQTNQIPFSELAVFPVYD